MNDALLEAFVRSFWSPEARQNVQRGNPTDSASLENHDAACCVLADRHGVEDAWDPFLNLAGDA